jgi:poly(3-hydroxybutyrate) depolymerase
MTPSGRTIAFYVSIPSNYDPTTPGDAATSSWTNTNDEDIAFAKAMVAWTESNFCVDSARILSVGI